MAVRIQIRRDNSTNWSSANPVLALGELGYDTTNEKLKIGDGVTAWNSLLYIASTDWDDLLNTPTTLSGYGITDAVTKNYVDNLVQGLRALPSSEAFSDSNLDATYDNGDDGVGATLTANSNGAFPTIDDVTLSQNDGVVVNGQTNAAHNGSYRLTTVGDVGTPWVLTRCGFCDEADEQAGSFEFITGGTTYGNTGWLLTVASTPVVMGTTELNWVQFSGAGAYTAGDGLDLAGTVFSVNVDDSTIEINSDTVRVKDSGITNAKLANPTITVTGDTGTSAIDLGDTLTISGTDPIDTTVSGDSLTLSIDDATTSSKGAASFNSANFTVSSGAVSSKDITLGSSTLTLGSTTTAIEGLTQLTIDNIDINGNTISSTNLNGDINLTPNGSGETVVAGNLAVSGTVDGRDVASDGTKLDTIETNADVTDTANVTAAGALMDSEVNSLSGLKTMTVPDNTTISAFGATLVDDADQATAQATLGLGDAATATVQSSLTDTTADRLMKVGAFGLGALNPPTITDYNDATRAGFYFAGGSATNRPETANAGVFVIPRGDANNTTQIAAVPGLARIWIRHQNSGVWGSWERDISLANPDGVLAIGGLTPAANKFPYFTGASAAALGDFQTGLDTSPTITAQTGTITTSSGSFRWARIGNAVMVSGAVTITDAGTGAGKLIIEMPFSTPIVVAATAHATSPPGDGKAQFKSNTIEITEVDDTTIISTGRLVRFGGVFHVT